MKSTAILVVAGVCALATSQEANAQDCHKWLKHHGDMWYVTPSGAADGLTDGGCIQQAFDEAQAYYEANPNADKPTVVFETGAFYLGEMIDSDGPDAELWQITTSRGTFHWCSWIGGCAGAEVAKPVKIRAPVVALGEPGSEVHSIAAGPVMGIPNPFVIDHSGVEIRNMTFNGTGVYGFHGGLTVEGCSFGGSRVNMVLFPDDHSVYPHYDDPDPEVKFSEPRKSYIIGNSFSATWDHGPYLWPMDVFWSASEVVFQGNTAYSDVTGLHMGGLDQLTDLFFPIADVYTSHEVRNNQIGGFGAGEGNTIDAGWSAMNLGGGHGGALEDNRIAGNHLTAGTHPISVLPEVVWGGFEVTARRNLIAGNEMGGGTYGIWTGSTSRGLTSENVIVDNTITGANEGMVLQWFDSSMVVGNTLEMDGASVGIRNNSDASFLVDNRFEGTGQYGVIVAGDANTLVGNGFADFAHADPDGTDVLFDYGTSDNLLFGRADVIDLGDNQVFTW